VVESGVKIRRIMYYLWIHFRIWFSFYKTS